MVLLKRIVIFALGVFFVLLSTNMISMAFPPPSPEIDPGTVTSAVALVGGCLLVIAARRRKN